MQLRQPLNAFSLAPATVCRGIQVRRNEYIARGPRERYARTVTAVQEHGWQDQLEINKQVRPIGEHRFSPASKIHPIRYAILRAFERSPVNRAVVYAEESMPKAGALANCNRFRTPMLVSS